jgi:phospholipase/carboxylesterase
MLHGRGSDEHDLFGLRKYIDPRLDIYSLRAPFEYEWGGYSWFDLFEDGSVDSKSFDHSKAEIISFITSLKNQKLFLFGFSMGAIVSYAIALTGPKLCNGILALSGFAPRQLEAEYKLNELQNLQIFVSHGINDEVIPVSAARKTKELLSSSNAVVTYKEYQMAHQINEECLDDIKIWLNDAIAK